MQFRPLIQNSSHYFSQLKRVCRTQTLTSTEYHNFKSTLTFLGPAKLTNCLSAARQKPEILAISSSSIAIIIGEYGSTLYVGLARAVSPTNTNFRLTFLLTRLQEALYEDLAV